MVRRHIAAFVLMRALLPFAALALFGCSHPRAPEPAAPRSEASANTAVQRVLEGQRDAFDDAVAGLHARREHPQSARTLARLLNLPLSEGDLRYAWLQRELYAELAAGPHADETDATIDRSFLAASTAALHYQEGHPLRALRGMRTLERSLDDAIKATGDVDLHAMLGNYAHQAGGLLAWGRARRGDLAVEHLGVVVERFDDLSPDARGLTLGIPGVEATFALWYAERLAIEGADDDAVAAYAHVVDVVERSEQTPALLRIASVARDAMDTGRAPGPDKGLWPQGYDACIACHARTASPALP